MSSQSVVPQRDVRLTAYVPCALAEQVGAICADEQRSVSWFVRRAVEAELDRQFAGKPAGAERPPRSPGPEPESGLPSPPPASPFSRERLEAAQAKLGEFRP